MEKESIAEATNDSSPEDGKKSCSSWWRYGRVVEGVGVVTVCLGTKHEPHSKELGQIHDDPHHGSYRGRALQEVQGKEGTMYHKNANEKWAFYVSTAGALALLGLLIAVAYLWLKKEGLVP